MAVRQERGRLAGRTCPRLSWLGAEAGASFGDRLVATALEPIQLVALEPDYARVIAEWAGDDQQLRWLAPSTDPPLTAEKVMRWVSPGGRAYVMLRTAAAQSTHSPQNREILGYAELNRMKTVYRGWWIGHFVVNRAHRGQGLGRLLLDRLLRQAFRRLRGLSVCLIVFPDNQPAVRCYENAGFNCTGEEYHSFRGNPDRERLLRYELTLPQWLHRQRS